MEEAADHLQLPRGVEDQDTVWPQSDKCRKGDGLNANRTVIIAAIIGAVAALLAALITALLSAAGNSNACSADHGSVTTCTNASGYFGALDGWTSAARDGSAHRAAIPSSERG
jgi:hypothetical protein